MVDATIIIPARGNPLGLWATVHSCEEDLCRSQVKYNYVIVTNGEKLLADTKQQLSYLEKTKRLTHLHFDEPLSPPVARQRGVEKADGEYLFFLDNHCLLGRSYFERVLLQMRKLNADMMHSCTRFFSGDVMYYHYKLRLAYNFWATSVTQPVDVLHPYRIAAAGHGAFAVKRTSWDAVGGYGPEHLLDGYGGEEMLLDLKMGRCGMTNYLDPRLYHYHYAGIRGYARHYTDAYYTNLLTSALVVGGEDWMYKVALSLVEPDQHIRMGPKKDVLQLAEDAYKRGAQYAKQVDAMSTYSLDNLLKSYRQNQVAM